MSPRRKIEIFSAGCELCTSIESQVRNAACESCEIEVVDMHSKAGAERARQIGVSAVPAVAIDGTLPDCCHGKVDIEELRAAGLGAPLERD